MATETASNRYRIATFQLTIQKGDRFEIQRQLHALGMPTEERGPQGMLLVDKTPIGSTDQTRELVLNWDISTVTTDLQPVLDDFGASEQLPAFDRGDAITRLIAIEKRLRAITGISFIYVKLGDEIIFN